MKQRDLLLSDLPALRAARDIIEIAVDSTMDRILRSDQWASYFHCLISEAMVGALDQHITKLDELQGILSDQASQLERLEWRMLQLEKRK